MPVGGIICLSFTFLAGVECPINSKVYHNRKTNDRILYNPASDNPPTTMKFS